MRASLYNNGINETPGELNSGRLKLPEQFVKVIIKSYPEIESIDIVDHDETVIYNPMNFEPIPRFLVKLKINFSWDCQLKGNTEHYTEKINTAFQLMYSDIDYCKFSVAQLYIPKRDLRKEFFDFFS